MRSFSSVSRETIGCALGENSPYPLSTNVCLADEMLPAVSRTFEINATVHRSTWNGSSVEILVNSRHVSEI
jgi:hypothetical protein